MTINAVGTAPETFDIDNLTMGNVKQAFSPAVGGKSGDLWKLHPSKYRVMPGFNVRDKIRPSYKAHRAWLKASMKQHGFWQHEPITVIVIREKDPESGLEISVPAVTDGHTRLEVALELIEEGEKIEFITAVTDPTFSAERITAGLLSKSRRNPLAPSEQAEVCRRLIGYGWEPEQIADDSGLPLSTVKALLELTSAPRDIRVWVQEEKIAFTLAIEMLRKHGMDAVDKIRATIECATAEGKQKASKRFAPGAARKKALRSAAEPLFTAVAELKQDPAYATLNAELREKLEQLLAKIAESSVEKSDAAAEAGDVAACATTG